MGLERQDVWETAEKKGEVEGLTSRPFYKTRVVWWGMEPRWFLCQRNIHTHALGRLWDGAKTKPQPKNAKEHKSWPRGCGGGQANETGGPEDTGQPIRWHCWHGLHGCTGKQKPNHFYVHRVITTSQRFNNLDLFTFRAFSRRFYPERLTIIVRRKRKKQYIAVGTVRMVIEPGAKH